MNLSWFIAKRYIQTNRRNGFLSFITTIAILGVMLGTAALIITLSVLDGFEKEIKEKVIAFTSHIEVRGFQNKTLSDYRQSIENLKKEIPNVKAISPFAAREGMIRFKDAVDGIYLRGIDPSIDVLTSRQHIVAGEFLSASTEGSREIVIGRKLANRLNVEVGDKLVVFALPSDNSLQPRAMQFQLAGIYESGMAEFDDIYAYTNLKDAQQLFQLGEGVSGYDVLVNDIANVDETARQIQHLLGYPHYSRTVFQLYRNLFSWIELQKKMSPILLSLIIVVATVNIIGTLLMFVLEKMKAIAILKSLGAGPKLIRKIFRLQGLAIAVSGIVLGNLLAYILCYLQLKFKIISLPSDIYYMDAAPILIRPENFIIVTIAALLLCMMTTLIPTRAASKLEPVTALRFG
ncbi:MAG: ABC transporter permease [Bacteroidota bacterium]|nr:ABC transporter permease [Bacteroidota bacterium]